MAIVDLGVGLAGSLRRRYPDVGDDRDALARIALGGLSAKSRENNAGLGLEHLRNITARLGGELTLISGHAHGVVHGGRPRWAQSSLANRFHGTALFLRMPVTDE